MLLGLHTYSFHLHGMGQNWGGHQLAWERVWDIFGLIASFSNSMAAGSAGWRPAPGMYPCGKPTRSFAAILACSG